MTQTATPMLTDDTGQQLEETETVRFGVDGSVYEIDLPARHASELRSMAGRYISVARRIQPTPSRAYPRQQHPPRPRTQADGESPGAGEPEPEPASSRAARKPAGRRGTAPAAQPEPAAIQSMAATGAGARGGEHGLTDGEKQELRTIADGAKPRRTIVAGRLRAKGLADQDTAGNWWLTDAGRRELISA